MIKKAAVLGMLLAIILINTGCYVEIERPEEKEQSGMVEELTDSSLIKVAHTFYKRGAAVGYVGLGGKYPKENGFYFVDGVLYFYDTDSAEKMCICNKAGCSHSDSDCPAVIPGSSSFVCDEDTIFDFSTREEGIQLIRSNILSGEKKSEILIKNDRTTNVFLNNVYCSKGRIVIVCGIVDEHRSYFSVYIYDIDKNEIKLFLEDDSLSAWGVMGVYQQYVLVSHVKYQEEIVGAEAFFGQNPDTSNGENISWDKYREYLQSVPRVFEKRLYDLDTMTYIDILPILQDDSDEEPNLDLSSNGPIYGEYILYLQGDQVVRYNMATGLREVLLERTHVVNGMLFDEKLFYIVSENGECSVFVYDPKSKETAKFYNNGNTQYMEFTIYDETKEAFIGYYNGNYVWIPKGDFYNERYDKAVIYKGH